MMKFATSLSLVLVILASLASSLPTSARADGNPVDLKLGEEGATSWNITSILPGDSGTETLTLHNAGDIDGCITICISDLVSSEGDNPESETGDTTRPGELDDYLLFNISCSRLSTNISLPTTIDNLPQTDHPSSGYLRVTPLNVGDTITLYWQWQLPVETDNNAQGDRLSFTINYMLEQFPPPSPPGVGLVVTQYYLSVDLWGEKFRVPVSAAGEVERDLLAISADEMVTLRIAKGVSALTKEGRRLPEIEVRQMAEPPHRPENSYLIGTAYDFNPDGANFEPPIELVIKYDPNDLPEGVAEGDLVLVHYNKDAHKWVGLDCVVDTEAKTITALVSHLTAFAIIGVVTPPPPSASAVFALSSLSIYPVEINIDETVTISLLVTNTGDASGSHTVTLTINGVKEADKTVTVAAGGSQSVTFSFTAKATGSYSVNLDGLSGSFTVAGQPGKIAEVVLPEGEEEPEPQPFNWFWVVIGLVVAASLLVLVFLVRFWRQRRIDQE